MSAQTLIAQELEHGITCIDAAYVKPGVACFYLLHADDQYAVIETGTNSSVDLLLQYLQREGVDHSQIRYVIPTHVHLDHAGGASAMMALFSNAELVVHPRAARHMADPAQLIDASVAVYGAEIFQSLYGDITAVDASRIHSTEDGETLPVGKRRLQFRHTEGHARHHHCIWDEQSRGWFTGDMFGVCYPWFRFSEGDFLLPATTPTQFDPSAYLVSLDILRAQDPQMMYLTHFGAVAYTAQKSELLGRQIRRYAELAADHSISAQDMPEALIQYSVAQLRDHSSSASPDQLRQWLELDIPLNSAGLLHLRATQFPPPP